MRLKYMIDDFPQIRKVTTWITQPKRTGKAPKVEVVEAGVK